MWLRMKWGNVPFSTHSVWYFTRNCCKIGAWVSTCPEALPLSSNVTELPSLPFACSVTLVTLFYLPGQWLIMKEVKTMQLTENLLICPLHLPPHPTPPHLSAPQVTNACLTFSMSLETLMCFDRTRQPVIIIIIIIAWFHLFNPKCWWESSPKKKKRRKPHPQTCSLPTGSDSWCWISANLMGQAVGGWELGLGRDSPERILRP